MKTDGESDSESDKPPAAKQEQDEEEENAGNAVDMFTKAGDNIGAQMMIDQQLGSRA